MATTNLELDSTCNSCNGEVTTPNRFGYCDTDLAEMADANGLSSIEDFLRIDADMQLGAPPRKVVPEDLLQNLIENLYALSRSNEGEGFSAGLSAAYERAAWMLDEVVSSSATPAR